MKIRKAQTVWLLDYLEMIPMILWQTKTRGVVLGYYLVCYNPHHMNTNAIAAVVPGYYLVCYNFAILLLRSWIVVVPGYYLVCYNISCSKNRLLLVVVPGYYLVCYNRERKTLHNPNDYAGF